ncbi:MAG: hypothetical protein QI223_10585 [Candidatus Korarchaeota archaeon]|nr:hypothetical protein [Candidatus Korarchaeota archaeon]
MYNPWFWLGTVYPYWYLDMFSLYPLMTLYWSHPWYWLWIWSYSWYPWYWLWWPTSTSGGWWKIAALPILGGLLLGTYWALPWLLLWW